MQKKPVEVKNEPVKQGRNIHDIGPVLSSMDALHGIHAGMQGHDVCCRAYRAVLCSGPYHSDTLCSRR